MMVYLGLVVPVHEILAVVAFKVAVDSMVTTWSALYMPVPSDSFSNVPLQVICLLTILTSIFCYTTIGSKMLKPFSQFGLLLVKQLMICLLYPHCISLNHATYHFTLTDFFAYEAPHVIARVCPDRLHHQPESGKVNGCDDVFLVVMFPGNRAHNV
ncbi:hypothetical protein DSO57_1006247 [Entomophthora muscae]|uniref:Uncharacterized protein n=1 Tax=Entomophthora muscae TaxID=34485 RepID=A0ACC2TW79_9FUNG|nr:hypothetical protein DSO57_1006247 [Entomophthora muscae]